MDNIKVSNLFFVLIVFLICISMTLVETAQTCTQENCKLPNCFCPGQKGPDKVRLEDTPQIIVFGFEDDINEQNIHLYRKLFDKHRKNPNGCRITATFFVSGDWTVNEMVSDLYLDGHEIGVHAMKHRDSWKWWANAEYKDWRREFVGQRDVLMKKASIPKHLMKGVRSPFQHVGSNNQFKVMKKEGFEYDSTFMTGTKNSMPAWPYTLDYPVNSFYCDNNICPRRKFPGIWEIPMNRWLGLDGELCSMVDACTKQNLQTEEDALKYLKKNFDRHYKNNHAPLEINMQEGWLFKTFQFNALGKFLDEMCKRDDVWILSMYQLIEWMRKPTPLRRLKHFEPWRKSCREPELLDNEEDSENSAVDIWSNKKSQDQSNKKDIKATNHRPRKSRVGLKIAVILLIIVACILLKRFCGIMTVLCKYFRANISS